MRTPFFMVILEPLIRAQMGNNGTAEITNHTLSVTGYQGAFFVLSGCSTNLIPTESCRTNIQFTPDRNGQFHNRLNVDADELVGGNIANSYSATVKLEGETAK